MKNNRHNKSGSFRNKFLSSLAVINLFLLFSNFTTHAATTCNPQSGITTIGLEWVARQCIPEGMNDSTTLYYINNMVECSGSTVTLYAPYGDTQASPAAIASYWKNQGYRVLRNHEGSHIIVVHKYYTGLIDGKDMDSYPAGGIYTDVLKEALLDPGAAPDCKGWGDFNSCQFERPASSTVNMVTGRLSHSQEVLTLGGAQLPLSVSLYYRSSPFAPSTIGNGWSHTYEATLQNGPGYSMVLWNRGTRRIYSSCSSSGPYISPKGDYSTLVKNADNSWTITETDGLKRNFNSAYNLTSIVDRYNNALTFAYTENKLSSVTDANGRSVTFGYNGTSGKLETVTDPALNAYKLGYTGNSLASLTPPGDNGKWVYTYNLSNGLLETKKDPENNISSYAYVNNRVQSATDPLLRARTYSYDPGTVSSGKIPDFYNVYFLPVKQFVFTEKDSKGWTYTFDTLTMNVRTATDPLGNTTTYYYNTDGTIRAKTEPFDGTVKLTTFYTYDDKGNLLTETDPVDISVYSPAIDPQTVDIGAIPIRSAFIYTYDAASHYDLKSVTDNRGTVPLTTTYDHYSEPDGKGGTWLVTRITAPGDTADSTLTSYRKQNGDGTLASITDANGKTTSFTYYPVNPSANTSGMLHSLTRPDNVKLTFTVYDKNGNPAEFRLTDSGGAEVPVKTTNGYDTLNRITSALRESTAVPAGFSPLLTTYGYDNNGNLRSLIDAENHEKKYEYNYERQLRKITDTVNGLPVDTVLEYGGAGCPSCGGVDKLTAVKDPNHVKNNLPGTVFRYDAAGRLEYETDPIGKTIRNTYFGNGLLMEKYDTTDGEPGKSLVNYKYNNRGQLTEKLYPDNTSVKFSYNSNGWLENAANMAGSFVVFSYTYEYYANGRLKNVTDSSGRKISYDEYDGLGQRKKVSLFPGASDEWVITYDYDEAGRPWHISSPVGIFEYGYDTSGRLRNLSRKQNSAGTILEQTTYGYDDLDRLTSLTHKFGETVISSYGYTHDRVDNIKSVTGSRAATYIYDEIYRLLNVVSDKPETFAYDDAGNRKTGPGANDTGYLFDDANEMLQGRNQAYSYDSRGNRITGNSTTLIWDYENRLKKVERISGPAKITVLFTYDPFGRRIRKDVSSKIIYPTFIKPVNTPSLSYEYVYDDEDVVLENVKQNPKAPTSVQTTLYIHGPGADEPLAFERDGNFYYYHKDGLGSITSITDQSGNVIQSYDYDSFGNIASIKDPSFIQPYTYTGREWDSESGLYYYRARYYDPSIGRFISRDPISFTGGDVNLYGYVQNNPVNLVDPDGLVARCTSGLDALGGHSIGPLYHKYQCWTGYDGKRICRGYGRDPNSGAAEAIVGPVKGTVLNDGENMSHGKGACEDDNNNKCMDRCVSNKWNNLEYSTPNYGWINGTQCKSVEDKIYEDCQKLCTPFPAK